MVRQSNGTAVVDCPQRWVLHWFTGFFIHDLEYRLKGYSGRLVSFPAGKCLSNDVHEADISVSIRCNNTVADAGECCFQSLTLHPFLEFGSSAQQCLVVGALQRSPLRSAEKSDTHTNSNKDY